MRIFLDFDYTVCNTALVHAAIDALPQQYDLDPIRFRAAAQALTVRKSYSLSAHLHEYDVSDKQSADIMVDFFRRAPDWLYPDAIPFLLRHIQQHDVYILSFGDPDFQRQKIESSGIAERVKGVLCVEYNKVDAIAALCAPQERFVCVDDRGVHLETIAERYPEAVCIQVVRPGAPYADEISSSASRIVHDLAWSVEDLLSA